MLIKGFQKLTLLDFPKRVAATVFTPQCDFRCPFCHNASLVLNRIEETENEEKILDFLKMRYGRLTGVAITGGEPLMQPDIEGFIKKLKNIGYAVKLDTNGSFPKALKHLLDLKLVDYVAMDIKNCKEKYAKTCGLSLDVQKGLLENIQESIDILHSSSCEFEFRTTLVKELHSIEDIKAIGQWLKGNDNFFLQGFKDSGDLISTGLSAFSKEEMQNFLEVLKLYLPKALLRGVD